MLLLFKVLWPEVCEQDRIRPSPVQVGSSCWQMMQECFLDALLCPALG